MKWKFMQIEPQPARGVLREEMWDSPDWIAEEKYDGDRRIAQFCGKVVRFTGRRKSVKDGLFVEKTENVPHLSDYTSAALAINAKSFTRTKVPSALDGTVLDGEMISHLDPSLPDGNGVAFGGLSKYVTSIMGSLPEEAVKKQIERGWLRYVVFDCLFYKGKDVRLFTWENRYGWAQQALREWDNPFATIAGSFAGHCKKSKRAHYEEIVARGGEGVILKFKHGQYGDKGAWVKVKKQATADVVIMGFIPAKEVSKKVSGEVSMTKYAKAGLIGAIRCGQFSTRVPDPTEAHDGIPVAKRVHSLHEVATVSGMTDDLRAQFTKHPKKYIGKVIEIEHNGREPTGRFRHPRFNRFRDDKTAKDCVYRDDES